MVRPARPPPAADRQPVPNVAPRNTYRTADGSWVAVSTSAESVAARVMRLVGGPR
ncbi:CoA transferase [Streptomyces lydicus]|nr:CoA transferase [Streptomyces lydicus]